MDYGLTETQQEISALAYQLGQQKIKPVREQYDNSEEFPWPLVEEFRKADLFGVYLPEAYGGLGGNLTELVLVIEQLSRACGGIALSLAGTSLGTIAIILFGNA